MPAYKAGCFVYFGKNQIISNLSQGSASSLNPSFLTVQRSIKAVLMTKPPSANGVHTAYSGLVEGPWDFCNSSTKDIKLGKPGIFNFDSLANEKILLLETKRSRITLWLSVGSVSAPMHFSTTLVPARCWQGLCLLKNGGYGMLFYEHDLETNNHCILFWTLCEGEHQAFPT